MTEDAAADALEFRDATAADYDVFVRFQTVLGSDDVPPAPRDRWLAHLLPHTRFLARPGGGDVIGYVLCKPDGARGDVRQVAVEPAWQGRGVGRRLMDEARARLVAAGCRSWSLEVLAGNAPALALYARAGLRETGRGFTVRVPAAALAEACAADQRDASSDASSDGRVAPAVRAEDVDPRDDVTLDAQFEITPSLASRRAVWPASRVLAVRRDGHVVGVCRINAEQGPGLALVWPCRADSPATVRALLAHAPRVGEVELYVQDAWLPAWLVSLGGRVTHELISMAGPLTG